MEDLRSRLPPRRSRSLAFVGWTFALLLALAGVVGWEATGAWRARAATRRVLSEAAAAMRMAQDLPEAGPLPLRDAWGRPVRMVVSPLGWWIASDGPDALADTGDDLTRRVVLSGLGRALDDLALAIREGGTPDLDTLSMAASAELGQPVQALIREDIVFENASGEVVLAVGLSPLGDPDLP